MEETEEEDEDDEERKGEEEDGGRRCQLDFRGENGWTGRQVDGKQVGRRERELREKEKEGGGGAGFGECIPSASLSFLLQPVSTR